MELEIFLKLLLSAFLGGIIGLERELSHKEAGLRTNILIAIGSTLLTILSIQMARDFKGADPARISAQIVTGIGFLGAGAIIQARFAIHGLTTAATIWTVAAIGIAVGTSEYLIAFIVTMMVLVILTVFKYISQIIEKQAKWVAYIIRTEDNAAILIEVKKILNESGIRFKSFTLSKGKNTLEISLILNMSEVKDKEFVDKIMQLEGVGEIISESL